MVLNNLNSSLHNMEELLISEDMGDEFYNDIENPSETVSKSNRIDSNEDFNEEELVVIDEVNCEFDQSILDKSKNTARQKSSSGAFNNGEDKKYRKSSVPNATRHNPDHHALNRRNERLLNKTAAVDGHHFANAGSSRQCFDTPLEYNRKYSHSSSHQRRSDNPSRSHLGDRYESLCNLPIDRSYNDNYSISIQDRDFRDSIRAMSCYANNAKSHDINFYSQFRSNRSSSYLHNDHSDPYGSRSSSYYNNTDPSSHSISDRRVSRDIEVQGYGKAPLAGAYQLYTSLYNSSRSSYVDSRHEAYPLYTKGIQPLIDPVELRRELNRRKSETANNNNNVSTYEREYGKNGVSSPKPLSNRSTPKKLTDSPSGRRSKAATTTARSTDKRNRKLSNNNSQLSSPNKAPTGKQSASSETSSRAHKTKSSHLLSPVRVKEAPLIDIKSERRSPSPDPSSGPHHSSPSCPDSPVITKASISSISFDKTTVGKSSDQLISGRMKQEPSNKISEETFKQAEKMGVDVTYLLEYKANEAEIQRRRKEIENRKAENRRQRVLKYSNAAAATTTTPATGKVGESVTPLVNHHDKAPTRSSVDGSSQSNEMNEPPVKSSNAIFRWPQLPIRRIVNSSPSPTGDDVGDGDSPSPSPTKKRRVIHSLDMNSASVVQNLSRNVTNNVAAEELRMSLSKTKFGNSSCDPNEPKHLVEVSHLKPFSGLKELASLVRHYFDSATVQKVSSDTRIALLEFRDEEEATDFVRRFNGFKLRESIIKVTLK